jgi:dsRNA-specific ribonuclease
MSLHTIEGVIEEFAAIVREATVEHLAPNWTLDFIAAGTDPAALREQARRWDEFGFEPIAFPARIEALADAFEALRTAGEVI